MKLGRRRNSPEVYENIGCPGNTVFLVDTSFFKKDQKSMSREELIKDYEAKLEYLRNDIKDLVDVFGRFPGRNARGRYQPKVLDSWHSFDGSLVDAIASETCEP